MENQVEKSQSSAERRAYWQDQLLQWAQSGLTQNKNWLFVGSDNGGERTAIVYSLVASCKLCDIDPFVYLRYVIDRVSTHPAKKISGLIPSN
jgi:hypothetical protein